jgi:crotonobetainyl-CoA:carnitine CoA-transferase CaiB-like acyl-CoA transferase
MTRLIELRDDAHLQARGFFREFLQPGYPGVVVSENGPGRATSLPDPEVRPAPLQGQHTREVAAELLGLSDEAIDRLVAEGVLEDISDRDAQIVEQFRASIGSPAGAQLAGRRGSS